MAKNMIKDLLSVDEFSLSHVSVLGRGEFGSVSLKRDSNFGFYAKKSSSLSLMKILDKHLRFHNHPRIVQASSSLLHVQASTSLLHVGIKPKRCYIYMEFASRGTLHNMISEFRGKPMPENMIGRAVLMILEGLEALHSQGYVHCDIKPANVLAFPSKVLGEPWELKLADFGLTKEPFADSSSVVGGTKQYMPPDSSLGPNGLIGPAFDIWSLGCVVLQTLKVRDLYTSKLPKLASPVANDFLRRCLEVQPSRRATAVELINHSFVTQSVTRQEMPAFVRLPCVIENNVMEKYSKRQGGPVVMT